MKRLVFVAAVLAAALAVGATRAKDSTGAEPGILGPSVQASSLGVSLDSVVGCRMSVRVDAGLADVIGSKGFAASGWKLVPWFYDGSNGWVEGNSSLHCDVEARADGGVIRQFICPDLIPAARFGNISLAKVGVMGFDGGTGADWIADGGIGPLPKYRIECWGPTVVGP